MGNECQKVKCVFEHHDWCWTLTEDPSNVFTITGVCRQCSDKNSKTIGLKKTCSLDYAFTVFAELRKG